MPDIQKQIDTRWQNLQETLQGIPEDRMTEPGVCGEWSVKDLMAHIAYWDDYNVEQLSMRSRGNPPGPVDFDSVNDTIASERADWTLAKARQEFEAAHQRKMEAAERHAELLADAWGDDAGGHYDEHGGQIRAWREQQGI